MSKWQYAVIIDAHKLFGSPAEVRFGVSGIVGKKVRVRPTVASAFIMSWRPNSGCDSAPTEFVQVHPEDCISCGVPAEYANRVFVCLHEALTD